MNRIDQFLSSLVDDWPFEDVFPSEEQSTAKRPLLPSITWTRQFLRKHGPTPAEHVLAAAKRAGYQPVAISATVARNRQWFVTTGEMWSVKPTAIEWLSDLLICNGETPVSEVTAAGIAAGFKASTIKTARSEVVGLFWRKAEDGTMLWQVRR